MASRTREGGRSTRRARASTPDRVLAVLGLFTAEAPEWSVEAVARRLNLALSTAYRYVGSLSQAGLITAFRPGRYVLGPAIAQFDRQIRLLDPLIRCAAPVLRRGAARIPSPVVLLLCRLYREQVMCVHQEFAEVPEFAVSYERGRLMPLHRGASSKIILAHLPLRSARAYYARHAEAIAAGGLGTSWAAFRRQLRELRRAGLCLTQGELDAGMTGIAVAVHGADGAILGSLSAVVPATHCTKALLATVAGELRAAGEAVREGLLRHAQDADAPPARPVGRKRSPAAKPLQRTGVRHRR